METTNQTPQAPRRLTTADALASIRARIADMANLPDDDGADYGPPYEKPDIIELANGYRMAGPKLMLGAYRGAMGIPAELENCTLGSFQQPTPEHQAAWDKVWIWLDDMLAKRNQDLHSLLLFGPTGCGKSHLAAGAMRELVGTGLRGRYFDCPELIGDLRMGLDDELFTELMTPAIVLIDDVGAVDGTQAQKDRLQTILFKRYAERKTTILTTNLDNARLSKYIGDRMRSRLDGAYRCVQCTMGDWRKGVRAKNA
jgi:hypothetical protein